MFDVTLYSQIENSIPVQLHNTNDYKVSITIKVSEEELTKRGIIGSNKEYFVYAAHEDGEVTTYEKLPVYKVTKNEDGTYSFIQPRANVNVEVKYKNRLNILRHNNIKCNIFSIRISKTSRIN